MQLSDEDLKVFARVGTGVQIFRGALILRPEVIKIGDNSRIDDFTRVEGGQGLEIGRHVHISSFCSIFAGGSCRIGDYACMAQGSRILTGSEQLDAAMSSVAPNEWRHVITTEVVLDHLSFLGANAVVMPGTSLAIGAVVGAGAVVTRPIGPWEVWAGVPARMIGRRDPEAVKRGGVPVDDLESRRLLALEATPLVED